MESVFRTVLNMSLSGAAVILVILLARLALKKAPRKWSFALWLAAAFRLLCPFGVGSALSLFGLLPKKAATVSAGTVSGLTSINYVPGAPLTTAAPTTAVPNLTAVPTTAVPNITAVPTTAIPDITSAPATALPNITAAPTAALTSVPVTAAPVSAAPTGGPIAALTTSAPGQGGSGSVSLLGVLAAIWLAGVIAMLAYGVISYIVINRRNASAMLLEPGGRVYRSDAVSSPYILGLFRPRIIIPYGLDGTALNCVLAHENCHIKRGDHVVKAFAFIVLAVHWFDPIVWLGFMLMSRDMEQSCDERVLAEGGEGLKKDYAETLLAFAELPRFPAPSPVAFGECDAKRRIKSAVKWKKPKLAVSVIAAVLAVLFITACVLNPKQPTGPEVTPEPETTQAPETPAPTEPPETEPPQTEEPGFAVPENAVYGPGDNGGGLIDIPNAGEVLRRSPSDAVLDSGSYEDCLFAVTIGVDAQLGMGDREQMADRLNAVYSSPGYLRYGEIVYSEAMQTAEYLKLLYNFVYTSDKYDEQMLQDAYWRAYSTEEEQEAYRLANERMAAIRDEYMKSSVMEEVERLRGLGLDVYYIPGGSIQGFLTAEQIKDFPVDKKRAYTMKWTTDPELRLDLNELRAEAAKEAGALAVTDYVGSGAANFAILADGSLWVWGSNNRGVLGVGRTHGPVETPVYVLDNVEKVVSPREQHFTLALRKDGSLWGWGRNNSGELGHIDTEDRYIPTLIIEEGVSDVFTYKGTVFALKQDGSLWSWGGNAGGSLGWGIAQGAVPSSPRKILEGVRSLSWYQSEETGDVFGEILALGEDGGLWTWGGGRLNGHAAPERVLDNVREVYAGAIVDFAITENGDLWAWGGDGEHPMTGCGNTDEQLVPVKILSGVKAAAFRDNKDHYPMDFYAILENGDLYAWGQNSTGELGTGDKEPRLSPVRVAGGIESIDTDGSESVLALGTDGTLYSWGSDEHGALGTGGTEELTPKAILTGVKDYNIQTREQISWRFGMYPNIEGTELTACSAIREDGSLWVWGFNWGNLLGFGNEDDVNVPTKLADNVRLHMAFANDYLTEDGQLIGWTFNAAGAPGGYHDIPEIDGEHHVIASGVREYVPGLYGWRALILEDGTLLTKPHPDTTFMQYPAAPFGG